MTPITILIVSPSSINRERIAKMFAGVPELNVIAMAGDLSETFMLAEAREPNVIVLSEDYRLSNEFTAMKSLFHALDARWIFAGSGAQNQAAQQVPGPLGRAIAEPFLDFAMQPSAALGMIKSLFSITRGMERVSAPPRQQQPAAVYDRTVVIGSSTGGVDALLTILSEFPEDCPPTAIVQHTGKGFSDSLIRLLERRCKPQVVAAQDGLTLRQGMVCVAAGSQGHMVLTPGTPLRCQIRPGGPVSGHVPSVDTLFRSALPLAPKLVGVILTGMGQDGAAGLLELRRAGCVTIGQDEASSIVYGMPRAAWEIGAVEVQLPLQRIAAELLKACTVTTPQATKTINRMVAR